MTQFVQPNTFAAILASIEQSIARQSRGEIDIEQASVNIVGVTLGNESLEIQDFYDDFPVLVDVVEGAADLEWQTGYDPSGAMITKEEHDQWVQEYWQKLKGAFEATKKRYNDNNSLNK